MLVPLAKTSRKPTRGSFSCQGFDDVPVVFFPSFTSFSSPLFPFHLIMEKREKGKREKRKDLQIKQNIFEVMVLVF